MTMNYYIKGDKERGDEVIAMLESKGGINNAYLTGNNEERYYYTDRYDNIRVDYLNSLQVLNKFCDELTLPEKKKNWIPKFKIGDYVTNKNNAIIVSGCHIFFGYGQIIDRNDGHYKIILNNNETYIVEEKQLYLWEPKRGDTVLVRNNNCRWNEGVFSYSYIDAYNTMYVTQGGNIWTDCIPFDENKLGNF